MGVWVGGVLPLPHTGANACIVQAVASVASVASVSSAAAAAAVVAVGAVRAPMPRRHSPLGHSSFAHTSAAHDYAHVDTHVSKQAANASTATTIR